VTPIVLIAEELSPATVAALGPDVEIRSCDGTNREELLAAVVGVDALLVRSATQVDAELLAAARGMRVVARAGVGLDNVDVKAATQAGVMVVNAPTSNIVSAAELAVGLLLASARNIVPANLALRNGKWARSKFTGAEITDKVVGIVGLGRIGLLVAQRLAGFGVDLIAYDPYIQPSRAAQIGVRMVDLQALLRESDFITVHLPKTPETVGLIGADALALVKPTVRIINAARGGIVDEAALYDALVEGRVAGAGLDVYATEPCTDSPLFALENVVATPHLGASTDEAQEKAGVAVARSVRLALAGEPVPDAVNVQGGDLSDEVRPAIGLAEHLGHLAAKLAVAPLASVEVDVCGEVAQYDVKLVELAALKGVLGALVHDPVSYVNAPLLAAERGVTSNLTTNQDSPDFRSLIRIVLACTDGTRVSVAGTVTGPRMIEKLVAIDGFDIDVPFSRHLAFFTYHDRVGIVGVVGQLLGEGGINIAGMQVSRRSEGGAALIALTVDSEIPPAVVAAIRERIGATTGQSVTLEL
jgi:D-3-phosphoglycerate dehydrogenase